MENSTTNTKNQILDAAEELFASSGFAGTSLRGVIRKAEVNLAAVHYHFGSKEELFRAVVRRVANPIVQAQLQGLAAFEAHELTVENIIRAFITPPLEIYQGEHGRIHAQFISRCRTEPLPVQQLAEPEFIESHQTFAKTLVWVLPNQSLSQIQWKLDLVVAIVVRVLSQISQPETICEQNSFHDIGSLIDNLVKFTTPGILSI